MEMDRIEPLDPCPYVIIDWAGDGEDDMPDKRKIDWVVKKYPTYWDLIICKDGKPDRAFRLFGKP